jgi:endonuclease V-like protein UPF0215 family
MRIVGVEDGSFQKGVTKKAVIAAILLLGSKIEGTKVCKIAVDGLDATDKLSEMLSEWEFDVVLLSGVSFAGFNVIDPETIFEKFNQSVIVISSTKPDNKAS